MKRSSPAFSKKKEEFVLLPTKLNKSQCINTELLLLLKKELLLNAHISF